MAKFFKTIVTVTVISKDAPPSFESLSDLHDCITDGDCSGSWDEASTKITGKQAADLLQEQASDPSFLGIDEDGNDIYEDGNDTDEDGTDTDE